MKRRGDGVSRRGEGRDQRRLEWIKFRDLLQNNRLGFVYTVRQSLVRNVNVIYPRSTSKEYTRARSEMSVPSRIEMEFGNVGF